MLGCLLWPVTYHRQPHDFKTRLLRRGFYTLIKGVSFSSLTDVGSYNPPPFETQHPRWHSFISPICVGHPTKSTPFGAQRPYWHTLAHCIMPGSYTICKRPRPTASRYCRLWLVTYCRQSYGFKMGLLGRGFHTLIKSVSFFSPTDVGS